VEVDGGEVELEVELNSSARTVTKEGHAKNTAGT
jgi:hypothetical protein